MKNLSKIFLLGALVLAANACTHEDSEDISVPHALRVYGGVASTTRAVDETWSAGDMIGVRAVTGTYNDKYKNACYILDGAASNFGQFSAAPGHGIYLGDEEVVFTAYAPYQESDNAAALPGEDGVITGISTAAQSAVNAQEVIDCLFAEETATGNDATVNFTFRHKMSKLVIQVVAGTFLEAENIQNSDNSFSLSGLYHVGSFNVTDGSAEADTSAEPIANWDLAGSSVKENIGNGVQFTAIIFPQTPESLTFSATINGEEYEETTLAVPTDGFEAGNSYTYTLKMEAYSSSLAPDAAKSINR